MKFFEGKISKKDLDIITKNIVNSDKYTWYYLKKPVTTKFPSFTHVMIPRYNYKTNEGYKINSPSFYFFNRIFREFCKKKKIKINRILRAAINLQVYYKEDHGEPHTDHPFPHSNCIMYLNTTTRGSTYLYKEKRSKYKTTSYPAKNVLKEIKNKAGKIVVFPGDHYHAAGHCGKPNERRIVCVFTFN